MLEESDKENKEKRTERQGAEIDDGRNEVSFSSERGFFFQGLCLIFKYKFNFLYTTISFQIKFVVFYISSPFLVKILK